MARTIPSVYVTKRVCKSRGITEWQCYLDGFTYVYEVGGAYIDVFNQVAWQTDRVWASLDAINVFDYEKGVSVITSTDDFVRIAINHTEGVMDND